MKKILFVLTLFWTVLSLGQTVTGHVYELNSTRKIPFAKISFIDKDKVSQTDSSGAWKIEKISFGTYKIEVSAFGYETKVMDINFTGQSDIIVKLKVNPIELGQVIVSYNGVLERESIANIESREFAGLNAVSATSMGQALANIPGVANGSIGNGIGKPSIRGLTGSSVVTYVNGLRIQNQQWGSDHGLPVTSLGIGRVELIKGPSSLLYGSDAIGGVLYFVDEPYAEKNTYNGFVQSKFEHNNLGTSTEGGFKWSKESLSVNVYGGYDNFADYTLPNDLQVTNSRFKQSSAKLAVGYRKKKWVTNIRYNFYNGRIGLPGHTHDLNPDVSSFQTTAQNRKDNVPAQRIQNHFTLVENKFFLGKHELYVSLGNTNNLLREHEEKFSVADINMNLNNSLYNVKWKIDLMENMTLNVGSQGMLQRNRNHISATEKLIPDANTTDLGLFALLSGKHKKWRWQAGGRLDNRSINTLGETNFSKTYQGLNYSAGFARVGKKTKIRFNLSSGFRSPNTSELLADGVHHGSFRYEIGRTDLKTEKAIQVDAGFAVRIKDFEFNVSPFYNRINDYIFIEKTNDTINGFNVYNYTQASFAQLFGAETGIHYHPHFADWIHLESNLSTVFGEDNNRSALPLIPQSNINTLLKVELKTKTKFRVKDIIVRHQYFFKQNRLGIFETLTPDYNLLNMSVNMIYEGKQPLSCSVGVKNLLNTAYINHMSGLKNLGLNHPGYNVYFLIRYEFGNQLKTK